MSLQKIQERLKAPKSQRNTFANFNYRNLEDILNAVKPLLAEYEYSIIISDEIVEVGSRIYVQAHAVIYNKAGKMVAENIAYAREPESKKGMDESQITGATSSYARKYCANGLFAIDDTKDADSMDNSKPAQKQIPAKQTPPVTTDANPHKKRLFELMTDAGLSREESKIFATWYIMNYQPKTHQKELTQKGIGELIDSFDDLLTNWREYKKQAEGIVS